MRSKVGLAALSLPRPWDPSSCCKRLPFLADPSFLWGSSLETGVSQKLGAKLQTNFLNDETTKHCVSIFHNLGTIHWYFFLFNRTYPGKLLCAATILERWNLLVGAWVMCEVACMPCR